MCFASSSSCCWRSRRFSALSSSFLWASGGNLRAFTASLWVLRQNAMREWNACWGSCKIKPEEEVSDCWQNTAMLNQKSPNTQRQSLCWSRWSKMPASPQMIVHQPQFFLKIPNLCWINVTSLLWLHPTLAVINTGINAAIPNGFCHNTLSISNRSSWIQVQFWGHIPEWDTGIWDTNIAKASPDDIVS